MKSLLPTREQIPIIITLAIVIMLAAGYLYIYKPDREKKIQKWRFRTLQNIDRNINEKIRNTYSFLDTYLKAVPNEIDIQNKKIKESNYKNFTVSEILEFRNDSIKYFERTTIKDQKLILERSDSTQKHHIKLEYNFKNFIEPLLTTDVFDRYIIFSNDEILFQNFHSGLVNYPQMLKDTTKSIKNSIAKDITIGGVEYKVFEQPISFKSGVEWTIIGLLTKERYLDEQSQLPQQVTLLLIILFCLILVIFPVIKLYQLGKEDTLTIVDGLSAMIVCMLMISLGIFTFLAYYDAVRKHPKDQMEILATQMSSEFISEIGSKRRMMLKLNQLRAQNKLIKETIDLQAKGDTTKFKRQVDSLIKGQGIIRIFWLDSLGTELKTWNSFSINTIAHNNYSDRSYFKKLMEHRPYRLSNSKDSLYSLDQVISWTSGMFSSVLSIPLDSVNLREKVMAISFKLKSLDTLKLPKGYSFAMTDNLGKVLYHSVAGKNLNENLMQEFSSCDELSSCLTTGSANTFHTSYFGKEYAVRIQPIPGLPYYLAIMDDLGYNRTRDLHIYTFTISMQILFSVFLILLLVAIYILSIEKSTFESELFDSKWISPHESYREEYTFGIFINLWIVIVVCFFPYETIVNRLYYILTSVCILPLFVNIISTEKCKNSYYLRDIIGNKINTFILLLLIFINISSFYILDRFIYYIFFQIFCFLPFIILIYSIKTKNWIFENISNMFKHISYDKLYTSMLFTWYILTHGVTIIIFFTAAYSFEQHLISRERQLDTAYKIYPKLNRDQKTGSIDNLIYKDSLWIADKLATIKKANVKPYSNEEQAGVDLFNYFRLYNSTEGYLKRGLDFAFSDDSIVVFNNLAKHTTISESWGETDIKVPESNDYLKLKSAALNYSFPSFGATNGLMYWLILIFFLLSVLIITHQLIKKIFALDIPDTRDWEKFDQEMLNNTAINNLLFMIGLPGSGKLGRIMEYVKTKQGKEIPESSFTFWKRKKQAGPDELIYNENDKSKNNVIKIDMLLIPDIHNHAESNEKWKLMSNEACNPKYKMVIVNHFEYDFANHESNYAKLLFLEKLLLEAKTTKLIILSAIHPIILLHAMNQSRQQGEVEKCMERWQVLLGHFRIVIHKISENVQTAESEFPILKRETRYTHFLQRLYQPLEAVAKTRPGRETEESLSFKLQTASYHFYFHIWQSLSKEEKFLLYDLAEDGLVNSVDKYTLCLLIDKGAIVRKDGSLMVFNRGFRNFILTGIGSAETETIIQKIQDNRNWNKIKIPLALICIAIVGLLLSSQHQDSTRLITTLSALAAAIPALINFISNFGADKTASRPK